MYERKESVCTLVEAVFEPEKAKSPFIRPEQGKDDPWMLATIEARSGRFRKVQSMRAAAS